MGARPAVGLNVCWLVFVESCKSRGGEHVSHFVQIVVTVLVAVISPTCQVRRRPFCFLELVWPSCWPQGILYSRHCLASFYLCLAVLLVWSKPKKQNAIRILFFFSQYLAAHKVCVTYLCQTDASALAVDGTRGSRWPVVGWTRALLWLLRGDGNGAGVGVGNIHGMEWNCTTTNVDNWASDLCQSYGRMK